MINLQNVQVKNGSTWQKICPFPIGFVYSSYTDVSPGSTFGGTWTPITGRFPYFNAGTDTGGSNSIVQTIEQMPRHDHPTDWQSFNEYMVHSTGTEPQATSYNAVYWYVKESTTVAPQGGGQPMNNMPAYQTLYAWRRTA